MKRLLLSFILATSFTTGISAAPVSRCEALAKAERFLARQTGLSYSHKQSKKQFKTENASSSSLSPYYIFNLENEGGFVVVAGDDRARTILAYSDTGSLNETDMPEACRYWLNTYTEDINSLTNGETAYPEDFRTATPCTDKISPLIRTRWGQNFPYNLRCPKDKKTGLYSATGCVATATAQVMRFHSYPEKATGFVRYSDNTQETERTLDFSNLNPFDWDNMSMTYDDGASYEQIHAVSTLMMAVGFGTQMQYSSDTSLAYHRSAGDALINYFGYDRNLHLYERDLMTDTEWENIILDELKAGRPVIYDGHNPEMGHTFLCDGYDGNGLFHFNWGWSGLSDGYFSLSALNPGQQSTGGSAGGYNGGQKIICRITPPGKIDPMPQASFLLTIDILYLRDVSGYHIAADTPSLEATLADSQFFFNCFNKGYNDFSGEIHAAIIDGDEIRPIIRANSGTITGGSYGQLFFPLANAGLGDGTYKIGFVYRLDEADEWHRVAATPDKLTECTLIVKGNKVTFQPLKQNGNDESSVESALSGTTAEITLFDINGRKVLTATDHAGGYNFDTSTLPGGIYILHVRTSEGTVIRKIVI